MSILAVVVGHWMVSMIWWQGGILYLTNAIPVTPGLWLATWVFQVMPVFFFVGGFSNPGPASTIGPRPGPSRAVPVGPRGVRARRTSLPAPRVAPGASR